MVSLSDAVFRGAKITTRGYSIFDGTMVDMTYTQIEDAAKEKAIILFPIGVIEQHGPHLPLGVDIYEAYVWAKLVKVELEGKGIRSVIAPPFFWGINNVTISFAGSFRVREETTINLILDIMASLKGWGFEKVFFINHHWDAAHNRVLLTAIQKVRLSTGIQAYWIIDDTMGKRLGLVGKEPFIIVYKLPPSSSKYVEVHAGGDETSCMWYFFPNLVDLEIWKTLKSTDLTVQDLMVWRRGGDEARKVTPQGFFGDPTNASPERGRRYGEDYGRTVAGLIEAFLHCNYEPQEIE